MLFPINFLIISGTVKVILIVSRKISDFFTFGTKGDAKFKNYINPAAWRSWRVCAVVVSVCFIIFAIILI